MRKTTILAVPSIAATVLVLAGCGGTSGAPSEGDAGTNRPTTSSSESPADTAAESPADTAEESPAAEEAGDGTQKFGDSYKYEDGLTVTVSKPAKFKPSDVSFVSKPQKNYRQFTITVVNKTGKPYDPSMFTASLQSGNEEMEEIFDSAKGFEGSPTTKVLNGRETKFKIGFGAADPADMVLEVAPGFEYESAIFTS